MIELLDFIDGTESRWMLTFDGGDIVTLEYFPESYRGDLEAGCGSWETTGTYKEVLNAAKEFNPK